MAYASAEARQQLLDGIADAIDEIGYALAALGAAYEQMDTSSADRLEEELFGPVQKAYGRAKRTYAGFADRHGLTSREFEAQSSGLPSTGAKGFVESAVDAIGAADSGLATVQDSPETLEVGDAELRAGLIEVRELLGPLRGGARELLRGFGR
jgi:hypothetical protein